MVENRVFTLDKIPEGSRLEKYLQELPKVMKSGKAETLLSFLNDVFLECLEHIKQNVNIMYLPSITLSLVPRHEQFVKEEQLASKRAISREVVKAPVTAFVVGNMLKQHLYVDLQAFIDQLHHGYPTFIINLVETYIHEILHIAFSNRKEQEIYDLHCSMTEAFLGIELPEEIKNLKASDYYSEKASENS